MKSTKNKPREPKPKEKPAERQISKTESQIFLRDVVSTLRISMSKYVQTPELRAYLQEDRHPARKAYVISRDRHILYLEMIRDKYTVKETAKLLKCKPRWIWEKKKLRKVLGEVVILGTKFYQKEKVEAYLKLYGDQY